MYVSEKMGGEEKNSEKCFKGNVFWIQFNFVVVVAVVVGVTAAAAR